VIGCDDLDARAVLLAEAERVGAPVDVRGRDFDAERVAERDLEAAFDPRPPARSTPRAGIRYRGPGGELVARLALAGDHQIGNAALALCAVARAGFRLSDDQRRAALANVRWPARLELVAPDVLVDAAHNPDGARALARALPSLAAGRQMVLVFGVVDDKDAQAMLAELAPRFSRVVLTRPGTPRARDPETLREWVPAAQVCASLPEALSAARGPAARGLAARGDTLVVVAGSIFLAGEARALLLGEPTDPIAVQDPAAKNL
jgi:dihydrofolate synthase/folylpolyglutamate synthase